MKRITFLLSHPISLQPIYRVPGNSVSCPHGERHQLFLETQQRIAQLVVARLVALLLFQSL